MPIPYFSIVRWFRFWYNNKYIFNRVNNIRNWRKKEFFYFNNLIYFIVYQWIIIIIIKKSKEITQNI